MAEATPSSPSRPSCPHQLELDLEASYLPEVLSLCERELASEYPRRAVTAGRKVQKQPLNLRVAGDEITARIPDPRQGGAFQVRLTIPLHDLADGYSVATCSCQGLGGHDLEPQRCGHSYALQAALKWCLEVHLAAANEPAPSRWQDLFAAAAIPADTADPQPTNHPARRRLRWLLGADLTPVPCLQEQAAGGAWSLGRKLPWGTFASDDTFWLNEDCQALAARYQQLDASGDEIHTQDGPLAATGPGVDAYGLLQDLRERGHKVHLVMQNPPIPLYAGDLGLRLTSQATGFRLQVTVAGTVPQRYRLALRYRDGVCHKASLVSLRGRESLDDPAVLLTEIPVALAPLVKRFIQGDEVIPLQDRAQLYSYLGQLQQQLDLELPVAESVAAATADPQLVWRLQPARGLGLQLEALVRVVPGGRCFPVGAGPDRAFDLRDPERPLAYERDKLREQQLTRAAVGYFELDAYQVPEQPHLFALAGDATLDLLKALAQDAQSRGIEILWPKSSPAIKKDAQDNNKPEIVVKGIGNDWFDMAIEIDGDETSFAAIVAGLRKKRRYIKLADGSYKKLSDLYWRYLADLKAKLGMSQSTQNATTATVLLGQLADEKAYAIKWAAPIAGRIAHYLKVQDQPLAAPAGLHAQLRSYQLVGYQWLRRNYDWACGSCLADDMGLGKTIQTISLLLSVASEGPSLVICPKSLVPNWQRELATFAPDLRVFDYREVRSLAAFVPGPGDIVITTYGLLLADSELSQRCQWNLKVLDEAQAVKNSRARSYAVVAALTARFTLLLTGTPIENNLLELWSLMSLAEPELLGSRESFKDEFIQPIEGRGDSNKRQLLQRMLAPFLLRRLKQDYLKELPPKTEKTLWVHLSIEERQLYDACRWQALKDLAKADEDELVASGLSAKGSAKDGKAADEGVIEAAARMKVLAALLELRQVACHPRLVDPDWEGPSAKLMLLLKLCRDLCAAGHKALIFSQFVSHLDIIGQALSAQGLRVGRLDGSYGAKKRQQQVDAFARDGFDFFLISLKAGGTGLNLTTADYVIHMDPWWNPASEDQASDRAYRMGQDKKVTVYRLVSRDTVEEKIINLHRRKRHLAHGVLAQTHCEPPPLNPSLE